MEKVVIVAGARTPIGSFGGTLRNIPSYRPASTVLNEVVKRSGIEPAWVDDVIMGQSYQSGECANGARMAGLEAGRPDSVPGVTLGRRCCSGLDAIFFAAMKIQTGNADIVVAGGRNGLGKPQAEVLARSSRRNSRRKYFPTLDLGSISLNSMYSGTL